MAQELTERPTRDLDFFSSPGVGSVPEAREATEHAAQQRGWEVRRIQRSETFSRLQITGMDEVLIVDLAIDAGPARATIVTKLGPSYDPAELAGRKTIALFDRAEARDFADVYRLVRRFGRQELLDRAAEVDGGFNLGVMALMMDSLDRFTDAEIPVEADDVGKLRTYFRDWVRELHEETS